MKNESIGEKEEGSLISKITLQRYIEKLDEVIDSSDVAAAEELQDEILAVFGSELSGLTRKLTNYGFIAAFSAPNSRKTTIIGGNVDFIKDAKTLKSRLQSELEKIKSIDIEKDPNHMISDIDLSHELISACAKLADNPASYGSFDEDGLNREIRNFLDSAISRFGFSICDQTQQGLGKDDKKTGELDIRITKNGIPVAIFEGLIHRDKQYLLDHIDKAIGRYNVSGCKTVFVVEYSRNKGFGGFWDGACDALDGYSGISVNEVNTRLLGVRMMKGTFEWQGSAGDFYYLGVNCYSK